MTSVPFLQTRKNTYILYFTNDDKKTEHDIKQSSTETIISNIGNNNDIILTFDVPVEHEDFDRIIHTKSFLNDFKTKNSKRFAMTSVSCTHHVIEEIKHISDHNVCKMTNISTDDMIPPEKNNSIGHTFDYVNSIVRLYSNDSTVIISSSRVNNGDKCLIFARLGSLSEQIIEDSLLKIEITLSYKVELIVKKHQLYVTAITIQPKKVTITKKIDDE